MNIHRITLNISNSGTRNDVRRRVVDAFFAEEPGNGRAGSASRYVYYVETLKNGDRVFLQRPANLHNGFDFLICVENTNYAPFGARERISPSHDDIKNDLLAKKAGSPEEYRCFYELIRRVFECDDVRDDEMEGFRFSVGLPADHILKVVKWMFIEQDIRYWNYSGRKMLWSIIPQP